MTNGVTRQMKVRVKYGIFVERPPDEVFAFVSNVDTYPQWQSTLFEVKEKKQVPNGRLQSQARVRDSRNVLGKSVEAEWQVIDYEPGRKITLEASEGAPVYWQMTWAVEQVDGGTFLTGDGGGDMGDLGIPPAAVSRSCQHLLENDFATLRDLLEKRT